MPEIYISGLPKKTVFSRADLDYLFTNVARLAGVPTAWVTLDTTGTVSSHYDYMDTGVESRVVKVKVVWFKQPYSVKVEVAHIIEEFLRRYNLSSKLVYEDHEHGDFFRAGAVVGDPPSDTEPL